MSTERLLFVMLLLCGCAPPVTAEQVVVRYLDAVRADFTADSLQKRWETEDRATFSAGIEAVKAHLKDPLLRRGEEARLSLGGHKELHLIREEGIWKIASLE